jgi:hypothetical protein
MICVMGRRRWRSPWAILVTVVAMPALTFGLIALLVHPAPTPPPTPATTSPTPPLVEQSCPETSGAPTPMASLPPPLPDRRDAEAMGFDSVHNDVLVFGGDSVGVGPTPGFDDQWALDAGGWHELHPSLSPPAGAVGPMAEDPTTGNMIMVTRAPSLAGGVETWSWDGDSWTRLADLPAPSDLVAGLAVLGSQLMLVSESHDGSSTRTWLWTGSMWTLQHPATNLPGGSGALPLLSADPAHHRTLAVIVSHIPPSSLTAAVTTQAWAWDGSTWSLVVSTQLPGIDPITATMTPDPQTGSVLLYENPGGGGPCTWELSGNTWHKVTGASPDVATAYWGAILLSDPRIGRAILVGGTGSPNPLDALWVFSGSTWTAEPASALAGGSG